MNLRPEISKLKRIVIKIGSSGVSDDNGVISSQINKICKDISELMEQGIEVILISSGAINTAKSLIHFPAKYKKQMSTSQALAALGQPILMNQYQKGLAKKQLHCAQVLLTHEDLNSRERYLNARNMLNRLLEQKVLPVLNENDSVSYEEIAMGDNDQLASMVAIMMEADLLLMLTDADGLYNRNPSLKDAKAVRKVAYKDKLDEIELTSKSKAGTGGMEMKIKAAKRFNRVGGKVIIASHQKAKPVLRALSKTVGTIFNANEASKKQQKKAWIVSATKHKGEIEVDHGAYQAILKKGSLLPVGIKNITGNFKRGDSLLITYKNKPFAIGLSEYDAQAVREIKGLKSTQIASVLGYATSDVVIHRNNLYIEKDN